MRTPDAAEALCGRCCFEAARACLGLGKPKKKNRRRGSIIRYQRELRRLCYVHRDFIETFVVLC